MLTHTSFVTGLVDSKLNGQRKTMFQRAVDLGVPASFVELRHEATHRELPALIVLRNATLRSLEWLWDFYWVKVDPHAASMPGVEPASAQAEAGIDEDYDDDDAVVKESVRGSLGLLSTGGGEGQGEGEAEPPRKKRKALQHQSQERSATATQLVSICKASRKGVFVLSRVLLDEGVIVPAGRR